MTQWPPRTQKELSGGGGGGAATTCLVQKGLGGSIKVSCEKSEILDKK